MTLIIQLRVKSLHITTTPYVKVVDTQYFAAAKFNVHDKCAARVTLTKRSELYSRMVST